MNIKDVEALANLARIELGEDEKKSILSDMESILGYVEVIKKAETNDKEENYKIHNVWREDKEDSRVFSRDEITGQFPDAKDGFLKVKKIL